MRKDIHPQYRPILFRDISTGFEFVASSTFKTKESGEAKDGKTYPLCKMEISSSSHPFYTRTDKIVDSEGRVDKFNKKFKFKV